MEAGAPEDVEDAGGATVVEDGDSSGPRDGVEEGLSGGGSVVLGEPAGQDAGGLAEVVPLEGLAVAASAFGAAGGASAVDVGDAGVAQVDEVIDRLVDAGVVVGPYNIDGAVTDGASDNDRGHPGGQVGQIGRWHLGTEQNQRFAAVLEQARDGTAFVPAGGDGAQRELVVGGDRRPHKGR